MTDYDIQRTAQAVVDMLLSDDRFLGRMQKIMPRRSRMLSSAQAAERLGISADRLRRIAPYIGGIKKGTGKQSQWAFEEDRLKDRYLTFINAT